MSASDPTIDPTVPPPYVPLEPADGDAAVDGEDDLALPNRRRRVGPLTACLVLLLVGALGVYGGVRLQKSRGSSSNSTSSLAAAFAARLGSGTGTGTGGRTGTGTGTGARAGAGAGGFGGFGGGGAGGAGGGATFGSVKLVDGNTIYVALTDGSIVKVKTTPTGTTVTKTQAAKVSEIQPGETVVVRGATGSDGTVTATSVTDAGTQTTATGG